MNKRIEELTSERDGETRLNGRPRTPDFLKPTKTQPDKNDVNSTQAPDFKRKVENQILPKIFLKMN